MTSNDDTANEMPVTSEEGTELGSVIFENEASMAGSRVADADRPSGTAEEDVSAAGGISNDSLELENPDQAPLASQQVAGKSQERQAPASQVRDAQGAVPTAE